MKLSQNPNYVPGFRDIVNLRDLGGRPRPDGRRMRRGLVYRSGALYLMNDDELQRLRGLGLRYVLDLRSRKEVRKHPDPQLPGVTQQHISAAKDPDGGELSLTAFGLARVLLRARRSREYQGASLMDTMATLYARSMAFDNPAYRELFRRLDAGNVPLLFHCSQGKDRTGVAAILVMLALGYDEESVVDGYVLSNEYRAEKLTALIDGHRKIMSRIPALRFLAQAAEGVIREFGEMTIDVMKQRYGSMDAYFQTEYGLDAAARQRLCERYLEPVDASQQE